MITEEAILKNAHISTEEIENDIKVTDKEIKDFTDEKDVLMRNPIDNRVKIYMLEGKILKRRDFVADLRAILEYRKNAIMDKSH